MITFKQYLHEAPISELRTQLNKLIRLYRKNAAYSEQQGETDVAYVHDAVADDLERVKSHTDLTVLLSRYRKLATGKMGEVRTAWNDAVSDISELIDASRRS